MHDIMIKAVMNGFILHVGCRTVVLEGKERLLKELKRYLDDPKKVEEEYKKNELYPNFNNPPMNEPPSVGEQISMAQLHAARSRAAYNPPSPPESK